MENQNQIMRRTRSGKLLGSASTSTTTTTKKTVGSVVTTKKTVRRETVEVVVTPYDPSINRSTTAAGVELDVISTSTNNENQQVEVNSTTPWGSPVRSVTIDFGDKSEDQVIPPAAAVEEEEERRKEMQWNKEEKANEIETQQTRELIQDVEKQKQKERVQGEVQPEKKATSVEEDEEETQPALGAEVPPPPPPPEDEEEEEWFDVDEDEEPKEPAPKNAIETDREVTTPPRYEAPQKRDDEETTTKKKRKAPSSAKKSEEKTAEGSGKNKRKKKKKSKRNRGDIAADYKTYIYRVLKQVHPDLGISSLGMATVNSFLNEMYEKIGDEAARLSRYTNAKTLSARDIQDAVKMVLPGDLGRHAIAEGAKAINRYATY